MLNSYALQPQIPNLYPTSFLGQRPQVTIEYVRPIQVQGQYGLLECHQVCYKVCIGSYCYRECIEVC